MTLIMIEVNSMRINTLDDETKDINLLHYNKPKNAGSSLHIEARNLLKSIYSTTQICEEVTIPVRRGDSLYLDFFIPLHRIAVEVHGEQHFTYNSHFYKNKMEFLKAQKRDKDKAEWCELNNIKLVVLNYDEIDNWKNKFDN